MAYPATFKTLKQWLDEIDQAAILLKNQATAQKNFSLGGTLNMDFVRRFFDVLVYVNNFFISTTSVTGLPAYITSEKQAAVADPLGEFVAMRAQVVATLDWLRTNVPQDLFGGNQYKLAFAFPTDNTTSSLPLTFTAAQTASYRTQLDLLLATVS